MYIHGSTRLQRLDLHVDLPRVYNRDIGSIYLGCVDIGVKLAIIALGIKGRFYANGFFRPKGKILRRNSRSVQNGNILRGVLWRKSALVILCKVDIKG